MSGAVPVPGERRLAAIAIAMLAPAALLAHPGAALGTAMEGLTDAQFGLVPLVRSAQLTAGAALAALLLLEVQRRCYDTTLLLPLLALCAMLALRVLRISPREMRAAAAACGLDLTVPQESLIVDDVTYPLLSAIVRRPMPALYLNRYWFPDDAQLHRVLAARRAAGMLVDCRFTPSALAAHAVRSGRFCCLGAAALAGTPGGMR